jgi:hypothetical protein
MEHLRSNIAAAGCSIGPNEREKLEGFWEEFTGKGRNLLIW